jgi:uncharacterized protein
MEMQGQRQLAVTQQQAWDALNDPSVLKQCVPGCDKLDLIEEGRYSVGMALKIGPVSAKFNGKIEMSDIKAPESYTLSFDGSGGVAGFGKGVSNVKLSPNELGTMLAYSVNAQVGGKIAQMGQRLIDGVAKSMADDFFARFDGVLQERFPPPSGAPVQSVNAPGISVGAEAQGVPASPLAQAPGSAPPKPKQTVPISVWIMLAVGIFVIAYFLSR